MSAHAPALSRRPHRAGPVLDLGGGAVLALSRLHEICGPARRSLALVMAARLAAAGREGPVWWIAPSWQAEQLHAEGVAALFPPERLHFVRPKRAEDVLWTLEEVLRSGTSPLAVADIPGLPGLTAIRRLHLAAESGTALGPAVPLGLILTPGPGGAQGVESRWRLSGDTPGGGAPLWRLDRLRSRMDPPRSWRLCLPPDSPRAPVLTPYPPPPPAGASTSPASDIRQKETSPGVASGLA
ncbi:ImuA family protein [Pseudooceanicola sp. C21-150M6]|uniref:ImuA family protein n=1 Tax=Pseudooceanicola sp. C21-150M6 TaxID=3434355 RepID=UPI003D7FF11D